MKSHRGTGIRIARPADGEEPSGADRVKIEWERTSIEEAREDVRAGRVLEGDAAQAWLRRWAAGEPVPEDQDAIDKTP